RSISRIKSSSCHEVTIPNPVFRCSEFGGVTAKPEGSIAEGYVAEEALTFSSHYFRDVTMKFNRPNHNVDPPFSNVSVSGVSIVLRATRTGPSSRAVMNVAQLKTAAFVRLALMKKCIMVTYNQGRKVKRLVLRNNMTQIDIRGEANDQYILVTQVKQVFYLEDKAKPYWKVVEHVNHKKFSDGGVIVVEDDPDIIHFDNSSDLPLSTSLNDLDNATLHIDGQSTVVDAPPDIIDVPDEDDDIIGDEDDDIIGQSTVVDAPPDIIDVSDVEDLINYDDDGVENVYSSEEED
ncbi:hypothetical protein Tco_0635299, partial [Tanacetum coccineum]